MSTQEFKVGDIIRNDDYDRLPIGASVKLGLGFAVWTKAPDGLWRDASEVVAADAEIKRFNRTLTHLPDATEPEDTDDAYVEPEPLKEGDALLIWARVRGFADDRAVHVDVTTRHAHALRLVPHAEAIVRPGEGSTPPSWVNPKCTSLVEDGGVYYRCQHDEHADDEHRHEDSIIRRWDTDNEHGRITEGGAS